MTARTNRATGVKATRLYTIVAVPIRAFNCEDPRCTVTAPITRRHKVSITHVPAVQQP